MGQCYIWDKETRTCVPVEQYRRPKIAAPFVVDDTMRATQSMADGKWYNSKSEIRRSYKAHGLEEYGNDRPTSGTRDPYQSDEKKLEDTIIQAMETQNGRH